MSEKRKPDAVIMISAEDGSKTRYEIFKAQQFAERMMTGRMADGTLIGDDPAVVRWFAQMSRQLNPIGVAMPGMSGAGAMQAATTELAELRKQMADTNSAYWKGKDSARLQARYRELLEATKTK